MKLHISAILLALTLSASAQSAVKVNSNTGVLVFPTASTFRSANGILGSADVSPSIDVANRYLINATSGTMVDWSNATTNGSYNFVSGILIGDGSGLQNLTAGNIAIGGTLPLLDGSALTNIPITTGIAGLGTGIATFLSTPSIAHLLASVPQVARTDAGQTFTGAQVMTAAATSFGYPLTATNTANDQTFMGVFGGYANPISTGSRVTFDLGANTGGSGNGATFAFKYVGSGSNSNAFEVFFFADASSALSVDRLGNFAVKGSATISTFLKLVPGTAPTAAEGAIYANASDHHLYFYNGSAWVQLDN